MLTLHSVGLYNGSFIEKVESAVGKEKIASTNRIKYESNNIGFSAKTEKTVVPIIVEIGHK